MNDTPSHRIKMPDPVAAVTTYTETPVQVQREKQPKKPEPKKEENSAL